MGARAGAAPFLPGSGFSSGSTTLQKLKNKGHFYSVDHNIHSQPFTYTVISREKKNLW